MLAHALDHVTILACQSKGIAEIGESGLPVDAGLSH